MYTVMKILISVFILYSIPVLSRKLHANYENSGPVTYVTEDAFYLKDDAIQPSDLSSSHDVIMSGIKDQMSQESHIKDDSSKTMNERDLSDWDDELLEQDVNHVVHQIYRRSIRERIEAKIEVLIVIDNSIYRHYLKKSRNNEKVAVARIRRYYGMVLALVDQRFQTINDIEISISVKISGIKIAQTRQESAWLEYVVQWGKSTGRVNANTALHMFQKWLRTQEDLPKYDHAIVFTRYLLVNRGSVEVGGMAFVNTICKTADGSSASIVADLGDFQCVKVVAHELGHSLGAPHDGQGKSADCPPDHNYVMSPQNNYEKSKLKNAFTFSYCSIREMKALLKQEGGKCVRDTPQVHYQYNLKRRPPGKVYSASVQCKLIFGKKSGVCTKGKMRSDMCGRLWCKDPVNQSTCRTSSYLAALPGTKCGRGKVCHIGECVPDPNSVSRFNPITLSNNVLSEISHNHHGRRINNRVDRLYLSRARLARPKSRSRSRSRSPRRKPENCIDKNATYCRGLLKINSRACRRRQVKDYCCDTCFSRRYKN